MSSPTYLKLFVGGGFENARSSVIDLRHDSFQLRQTNAEFVDLSLVFVELGLEDFNDLLRVLQRQFNRDKLARPRGDVIVQRHCVALTACKK